MSGTVYWERIDATHRSFNVGSASAFGEIMRRRFGSEPWEVSSNDLTWLQGVADSGDKCAAWDEIIEIVQSNGAIKVWREY